MTRSELDVGQGSIPQAGPDRGGGAKSSALRSGDIAWPMQAHSVTPKSPSWVNEVMTKPSVQPRWRGTSVRRGDNAARSGPFICAQKIVQAGDNRNNNKKLKKMLHN